MDLEIYPALSTELSTKATAAVLARSENRTLIVEEIGRYLAAENYQGVTVALPTEALPVMSISCPD